MCMDTEIPGRSCRLPSSAPLTAPSHCSRRSLQSSDHALLRCRRVCGRTHVLLRNPSSQCQDAFIGLVTTISALIHSACQSSTQHDTQPATNTDIQHEYTATTHTGQMLWRCCCCRESSRRAQRAFCLLHHFLATHSTHCQPSISFSYSHSMLYLSASQHSVFCSAAAAASTSCGPLTASRSLSAPLCSDSPS